jgi:polyferredoxin
MNHLLDPIPQKKFKILQPRTFLYTTILILVSAVMVRSLILKPTLETSILPDRNPIFVTLSDGSIRNGYTLKLMNKTHENKIFSLKINAPKDAVLKIQNVEADHMEVAPDSVATFKVYVIIPKIFMEENEEGRGVIEFLLIDEIDKKEEKVEAVFIGK